MPTIQEIQAALPSRYTLQSSLDAGGQGAVFLGTCDGAVAALKLYSPQTDPARVQRELDMLVAIQCPTLVRMLASDSIVLGGSPVSLVAYEYHSGGTLKRFLAPNAAAATYPELKRIGHDVAIALEELWARRIVHRDVKPANVVCAADGRQVLLDVGLARHLDLTDITAIGAAAGTMGYMSPEQSKGRRQLTIHTDVFALGVTLYEIAARQHPFGRQQAAITQGLPPLPLAQLRQDLPAQLILLINEMMRFSAARRPTQPAGRFAALP